MSFGWHVTLFRHPVTDSKCGEQSNYVYVHADERSCVRRVMPQAVALSVLREKNINPTPSAPLRAMNWLLAIRLCRS